MDNFDLLKEARRMASGAPGQGSSHADLRALITRLANALSLTELQLREAHTGYEVVSREWLWEAFSNVLGEYDKKVSTRDECLDELVDAVPPLMAANSSLMERLNPGVGAGS
jgi:hypothetical protein